MDIKNLRSQYAARERNFQGITLHQAKLSRMDLSGADLSGADLSGADLSRAKLKGCKLNCANLTDADLSGADLTGCNLTDINLIGADLINTNLKGSTLELILFALNQVTQRLQTAMEVAIEKISGVERLVEMLFAFLPLDNQRRDILRVWVAFLGYAIGRESLMAEHQRCAAQLRQVIIHQLQDLQSTNLIRADVEVEIEANALLALVNGVSLDSLIQGKYLTPDQQKTVIWNYVNKLLVVGC